MEYRITPKEDPEKYLEMPEGLKGYWWEAEHLICIPVVISPNEGEGTFSRWLKELEAKGKVIFFPTLVSARLDSILRLRGYVDALNEFSDTEKEIYGQTYCDGLALFPNEALQNTLE